MDHFRDCFGNSNLRHYKPRTVNNKGGTQCSLHGVSISNCCHHHHHTMASITVLALPSERTLRDYTHWVQASPGFHWHTNERWSEHFWTSEVHPPTFRIKEDLNLFQIIGFVSLCNVNNQVLEFERSQTGESQPHVATLMLVFMVRGLFSHLEFPYGQIPTSFFVRQASCPNCLEIHKTAWGYWV